ncbi:MAG: TSUP family transporter [Candidatus Onthomonas sp.]
MSVGDWLTGALAGGITGLLSAFGLGGGTLLLLWLTLFAGIPQQTAQAINLLYFLPVSAAALPGHFRNGYLKKRPVLWAAGAGILTAAAGAFAATWIAAGLLRKCFGVYLLVMGAVELFGKKEGTSQS